MKRIAAFDANLIALVQEGYLWVWDRTGATVGMCIFTLTMPGLFLDSGGAALWLRLLVGLVLTVVLFGVHVVQTHSLRSHNDLARTWRESIMRALFALTGAVAVYNRLSQSQQQHLVCFTHIADERICNEWGWKRL